MNKRRILFLYWGKKGGGARYSLHVAAELAARNDVNLHLSVSRRCRILDQFEALSLPTLYVDTYDTVPEFLYMFVAGKYRTMNRLKTYLRNHRIDTVIVGMDFFWGKDISAVCREVNTRVVYVVHEPRPHPKESLPLAFAKKRLLRQSITAADHVVCLNGHVKSFIQQKFNRRDREISVIPHGIFSYYKTGAPKTIPRNQVPVTVLYFGRIEYYKGLDILLEAFGKLEKRYSNTYLEVWGAGDLTEYEALISGIRNIRIENRWIGEDEIEEVFRRSHICVLPYRDASQSGVAGMASEAGLPIVACPSEGLKEQLQGAGAVISEDFTPQGLADALERLITDPRLYEKLSRQAIRYANSLSWATIAGEFKVVCDKLHREQTQP